VTPLGHQINLLILKEYIMSTFANAVINQEARTTNGMKARKSTANAVVDLFYNIGASRGKNVIPQFVAALVEDRDLALRVAAWSRDVRGGAGERKIFRDILSYLETNDVEACKALLAKVPELGRWDDIFIFKTDVMKTLAYTMLGDALRARNGLAAKWTPRKGPVAAEIRKFFGMSPKFYRKSLVELTNVVETQMCAKDWNEINFSHVPSVAASRYKKAFNRNTPTYATYVAALVKGDVPGVKVNASAVYPYDVLKGRIGSYRSNMSQTELDLVQKQWEALPNYVGDSSILPLVDSSGSMSCSAGSSGMSCLDVAVSLGLYLADKNTGKFKDTFLTFSNKPQLVHLKGNINQKISQMCTGEVSNTNLNAAFDKILEVAKNNNVPQEEMPKMLLILSDMQFDGCVGGRDDSAMQMITRKYKDAGYDLPKVAFWNLNAAYGNAPVKFDKSGTALVSGFSPAVVKPLLSADLEVFTPASVMLKTIMDDRYTVL
jgi:Domain of unknown function (DUF2828)